jgi:hypothetical protein
MTLRRLLAAIYLAGAVGLAAELLLLGHVEDRYQLVPLVLLGASVATLAWHAARPSTGSRWAFRLSAWLLVAGGLAGLVLHYQSNVEFELEMYPDLAGLALIRGALTGAIPALAPGALIQLGLVGLAYAYQEHTV